MGVDVLLKFGFLFLSYLLTSLKFVVFLVVILSWFQVPRNKFTLFLTGVAAPILKVARKITPRTGMIDFSPIVAFVALDLIHYGLGKIFESLSG